MLCGWAVSESSTSLLTSFEVKIRPTFYRNEPNLNREENLSTGPTKFDRLPLGSFSAETCGQTPPLHYARNWHRLFTVLHASGSLCHELHRSTFHSFCRLKTKHNRVLKVPLMFIRPSFVAGLMPCSGCHLLCSCCRRRHCGRHIALSCSIR